MSEKKLFRFSYPLGGGYPTIYVLAGGMPEAVDKYSASGYSGATKIEIIDGEVIL
jgi:hypothetical protein